MAEENAREASRRKGTPHGKETEKKAKIYTNIFEDDMPKHKDKRKSKGKKGKSASTSRKAKMVAKLDMPKPRPSDEGEGAAGY